MKLLLRTSGSVQVRSLVQKSCNTSKRGIRQDADRPEKIDILSQYRVHVQEIAKRLGLQRWEDWYLVKVDDFMSNGGRKLYDQVFERNLERGLILLFPEHNWELWRFAKLSSSTELDPRDQRGLLENVIGPKVGVRAPDDWYQVSPEKFFEVLNGSGLSSLAKAYDSMVHMLLELIPDHPWHFWRFQKVPETFWREKSCQTAFLTHLSESLGLSSWEDWYQVKVNEIKKHGGGDLLKLYNNSQFRLFSTIFPSHPWNEQKFHIYYWKLPFNLRSLFDRIAKQLELHQPEDWYQVKLGDLKAFYGVENIIEKDYQASLYNALSKIYPEHNWQFWKFVHCPNELWEDKENQRHFLDSIGENLGIKNVEDWYQVSKDDIRQHLGGKLLKMYGEDVAKMVKSVYDDRVWDLFRFNRSRGFWAKKETQRAFFEALARQLDVKRPDDWYQVKLTDVYRYGGSTLLTHYYGGSLSKALSTIYPECKWDSMRVGLAKGPSKSQLRLWNALRFLFPNTADIHMEYLMEDLRYSESKKSLLMDVFIPSLRLAFEYHGEQHYKDTALMENLDSRQKKDEERRNMFANLDTTLIEIPYWWDGTTASLKATIHKHRPDLFPDPGDGAPIPDQQTPYLIRHNFS